MSECANKRIDCIDSFLQELIPFFPKHFSRFREPVDRQPGHPFAQNHFANSNSAGLPEAESLQIQTWNLPGSTSQLPFVS
jgi:hypothetical protein